MNICKKTGTKFNLFGGIYDSDNECIFHHDREHKWDLRNLKTILNDGLCCEASRNLIKTIIRKEEGL